MPRQEHLFLHHHQQTDKMAAVYKSLSKSASKADKETENNGTVERKNKQRVLILSSRGVTYRYESKQLQLRHLCR
jgi:hypothetical protein